MFRLAFTILFFSVKLLVAQQSFPPIGQWQEHLPYNSAIDVTASTDKVYCATSYSLFSVNINDNSIERISRMTGLSETGISTILYDEINNKLLLLTQIVISIFFIEMIFIMCPISNEVM